MAIVVITGCSSGIGYESALAFARRNDRVYASMRNTDKATALLQHAGEENLDIRVRRLDVTCSADFPSFVDDIVAESGGIDILINNAGILRPGAWEDLPEETARLVMETNFFGPMLLSRAVLPQMRRQGQGTIIMISSLSGIAGLAGDVAYSASKFALEGATEALRHEIDRWGIHVALVQGGQYATGIFDADRAEDPAPNKSTYHELVTFKQRQTRDSLANAHHPRQMAELLLKIADSDGTRLRWPADELATRVLDTLLGDDSERDSFLRMAGGSDWWSEQLPQPD